ncbi:hypothetical protein KUTeg_010098 [Tegillarca granosa]|uniref:EGF-like domain-containing protein n=1 Tax=Tegillarca granosa TaxID=220873 RepID=A0ABQ9F5R8_TEGGR|nr:hypothetical protein KUTeg_010098 [Tegillarca granosa]
MEIPKQEYAQLELVLMKMKVFAVFMILVCITEAYSNKHADVDGANKWINVKNSQSPPCVQRPTLTCNGKKNDTTDESDTNSKEDVDGDNQNQGQTEEDSGDEAEADDNSSDDSDKDGCSSTPCQNGGTCAPNPTGFTCYCPNGIEGEFCEYDNAEMKVEDINYELNLFDEDLKEDVEVAARMLAQKFDEKDNKMKRFLQSLLPRVLSCLMFPEGENKMEDILDDIFGYYGQKDALFIKTTLYRVLEIIYKDRVHEKKHIIQTILKITGGIEYYDIIQKLSETIYFTLSKSVPFH